MQHVISQDIKTIARRTLEEIFPRGDVAALAQVVHHNIVDHDGPPGAPPGLDGMTWSMCVRPVLGRVAAAVAPRGVAGILSGALVTVGYAISGTVQQAPQQHLARTVMGPPLATDRIGQGPTQPRGGRRVDRGVVRATISQRELHQPRDSAPAVRLQPRGRGDGGAAGLHRRAGCLDPTGALVGAGDIRAQTRQVFDNLRAALEAVGAGFEQVVKLNLYLVDATQLPVIREVRDQYVNTRQPSASTAVEVRRLFREDALIEVEAVAVIASAQPPGR